MKETTQHQAHHNKTFGSSFFWGVILGAAGLYLLGTKNGRHIVKRLMDSVENLEGSAEEIFEVLEDKAKEDLNLEGLVEAIEKKKEDTHLPSSNLHSIMEKIKSAVPLREETNHKKYFSKDGMIIK